MKPRVVVVKFMALGLGWLRSRSTKPGHTEQVAQLGLEVIEPGWLTYIYRNFDYSAKKAIIECF